MAAVAIVVSAIAAFFAGLAWWEARHSASAARRSAVAGEALVAPTQSSADSARKSAEASELSARAATAACFVPCSEKDRNGTVIFSGAFPTPAGIQQVVRFINTGQRALIVSEPRLQVSSPEGAVRVKSSRLDVLIAGKSVYSSDSGAVAVPPSYMLEAHVLFRFNMDSIGKSRQCEATVRFDISPNLSDASSFVECTCHFESQA